MPLKKICADYVQTTACPRCPAPCATVDRSSHVRPQKSVGTARVMQICARCFPSPVVPFLRVLRGMAIRRLHLAAGAACTVGKCLAAAEESHHLRSTKSCSCTAALDRPPQKTWQLKRSDDKPRADEKATGEEHYKLTKDWSGGGVKMQHYSRENDARVENCASRKPCTCRRTP